MKSGLLGAAVLAAVLASFPVYAQPTKAEGPKTVVTKDYTQQQLDGAQVVTFTGDQLPGDTLDPYGGIVRPPPGVLRAQLIRPRLNFVSELLKSVENL